MDNPSFSWSRIGRPSDASQSNVDPTPLHTGPDRMSKECCTSDEFAEPIPEYLREGYRALMQCNGQRAIELWEALYARFPSAEVCGHLARAHYYQTYFLGHGIGHPRHADHIRSMRQWAERALELNPNSSIA